MELPKKKRARVARKPKVGVAGLQMNEMKSPFKTAYASVPRIMRSRIAKASQPSKPKNKKLENPEIPNQPLARSSSGKVALGPWTGAFGSGTIEPKDNSVFYIDRCGSTHVELNDARTAEDSGAVKGHRKGTILIAASGGLGEIPPPLDEETKKIHSREVASLQQKPIVAHWGKSECGKQARKGRNATKVGSILQPRRGL